MRFYSLRAIQTDLDRIHRRELMLLREALISSVLDHPNIVKCRGLVIGDDDYFYLFYDHVEGEDLADYMMHTKLGEEQVREIFRQVLSALEYAHRNHVVQYVAIHLFVKPIPPSCTPTDYFNLIDPNSRDLKLENIRYNEKSGIATLIDFGFGNFHSEDKQFCLFTSCGSPCYAPPEIFKRRAYWGPEVDVWCLGVCLYAMAFGKLPFRHQNMKTLISLIIAGNVSYPETASFVTDPHSRATLRQVLHHPWVNQDCRCLPIDYLETEVIYKSSRHPLLYGDVFSSTPTNTTKTMSSTSNINNITADDAGRGGGWTDDAEMLELWNGSWGGGAGGP
ncbi:serine/threonine-protein kinase KIN2 [Quaeritorhiza haematococci]|nr:serine/threonine-protein kinase KIN2 [Quaeritorhiza haematococci]